MNNYKKQLLNNIRLDIIPLECGTYVMSINSKGCLNATDLRIIADELDSKNFNYWYTELETLMNNKTDYEGLPRNPNAWATKETWMKHWKNGLSPEQAHYEEC